jgi:hypothetical protein
MSLVTGCLGKMQDTQATSISTYGNTVRYGSRSQIERALIQIQYVSLLLEHAHALQYDSLQKFEKSSDVTMFLILIEQGNIVSYLIAKFCHYLTCHVV